MIAFLLHIRARTDAVQEVVDGLCEIELISRADPGCVDFVWLQHDGPDGQRFTLFERWRSQEDLDGHLAGIIPVWEHVQPLLAEAPVSEPVVPVSGRAVAGRAATG